MPNFLTYRNEFDLPLDEYRFELLASIVRGDLDPSVLDGYRIYFYYWNEQAENFDEPCLPINEYGNYFIYLTLCQHQTSQMFKLGFSQLDASGNSVGRFLPSFAFVDYVNAEVFTTSFVTSRSKFEVTDFCD